MSYSAGSLVGPYTILQELPGGRGGMAVVCKAQLEQAGKPPYPIALKVMRAPKADSQEAKFFFDAINNEVEILKRLRHPNIVRIYPIPLGSRRAKPVIARDQELPGAPWYFAMEYLGGGSLRGAIKRRRRLPLEEAVEIACQLGMGLDYLHSKGIAHRDIKPDNILFRTDTTNSGRIEPVLVDFGIAAKLAHGGLHAGSIYYMSPERLQAVRGEIPPERITNQAAGDVYGLGVLLYQMLTGRRPFEGRTKTGVTTAILHSTPTLPRQFNREIPPELEQLIMQALSKQPSRRPSAEEMTAQMEQLVPPPRVMASVTWEAPTTRSRNPLPWALSALSTVGLVGVLGWHFGIGPFELPDPTTTPIPPMAATTGVPVPTEEQRVVVTTSIPTDTPMPSATPSATVKPTERPTKPPSPQPTTPGAATPTSVPTRTPTNTPRPVTRTPTPQS